MTEEEKGDWNVSTVLLSQEDIRKVMDLKEVVEITEKTFKGFGEGTTINPTKVGLDLGETAAYPPYQGFMNAMPAYVGWNDVAGIKWAGGFLGERKKMGLPYITSLILLINPKIGNFTAVMGLPTLDGLGPVSHDICSREETMEVQSLVDRGALLCGLIKRLPNLITQ